MKIVPYLDDVLIVCALASFTTASYLINAVAGTYTLGAAFLVAAVFAGRWMQSPAAQKIIGKLKRK